MTRELFLKDLNNALAGLGGEEVESILAYYSEMIDDRVEDGLTEEQAVAERPQGLRTFQLDCDRSPYPDTGYTGFAQYPDGEIYAVNYIADNACDCAQIRGYSFRQEAILHSFSQRVYTKEMVGE